MRITFQHPPIDAPTEEEALKLIELVEKTHGVWARRMHADTDLPEICRAFAAVSLMFRSRLPSKYAVSYLLDRCNVLLEQHLNAQPVSGSAFILACVASGDVPFQRPDPGRGVILEIALDPFDGVPARGVWRDVLSGRSSLLASTPPPATMRSHVEHAPAPRFFVEGRELDRNEAFWNRSS